MSSLLDWVMPLGRWRRSHGYPFLLDTVRWLWFPQWANLVEAYEIDSMAYIVESLDAWRP